MLHAIYVNSSCGTYDPTKLCMQQPSVMQGPSWKRFRKKLFSWWWDFFGIRCFFHDIRALLLQGPESPTRRAWGRAACEKEAGQLREGDAGEKSTWAGRKFFQDDVVKVSSVAFGFSGSRSCGTPHKTKEIENRDAIEETCTKKKPYPP